MAGELASDELVKPYINRDYNNFVVGILSYIIYLVTGLP